MRFLIIIYLFLYSNFGFSQINVRVVSWNLKDFGRSKTNNDIEMIAKIVNPYDILAIQEVVAGTGGPQAVARLADALNRPGAKWEYVISDVTSGTSAHKNERYAFLWKSAKAKLIGSPWLEAKYGLNIEREPFFGRFQIGKKIITLVSFHAITKAQQPEREIKYFKFLPVSYPDDNLVFCGDFNLPQSHSVFIPLNKLGYISALRKQKTSIRQKCINGDCLASEYDNFFFDSSQIKLQSAGVIHFYKLYPDLKRARKVSDHIPIFVNYSL